MIKIGNSDITSIKVGTSGCSAYLGDVKLYPTTQTPCYAVVNDISQYQGDEEMVYETTSDKWYMLNNLDQYEEYGIYGSGLNTTYYEGKLTLVGGEAVGTQYEYIYSGGSWVNLGEVSGGTIQTVWFDPQASGDSAEFEIGHYWGEAYKMVWNVYIQGSYTSKDVASFWAYENKTPIEFSLYNNGFYYDMHDPTSTSSPSVYSGDYSTRIMSANVLSNYENSQVMNFTLTYGTVKFELEDGTTIYSSGTQKSGFNWYNGLYLPTIRQRSDGKLHVSGIQVYNSNNELVNDIKFIKNNGVTGSQEISMYDSVLDVTYNNSTENTPTYHIEEEESGSTYPMYYDVLEDPPTVVYFNSMAEALAYECPYVGLQAVIDGVNYVFNSQYQWELVQVTLGHLCTEALGSGSITFTMPSSLQTSSYSYVEYSTDSGTTWTRVSNTSTTTAATVSVSQGDKVYWRGSGTRTCEGNATNVNYIARFSATTNYNVEGNAMSLLYGDNYENAEFDSGTTYHMSGLFSGDTHVINASGLTLPATTLYDNSYNNMFIKCSNLATLPTLAQASFSTTQSGGGCYKRMFAGCTSLTAIPSGMTIGSGSVNAPRQLCEAMFSGCTSLTTVPSGLLPCTTLEGEQNYRYMFQRCSGLTTVPSDLLPATTLGADCYTSMFSGCTSLTVAPQLPATTLASGCCASMFYNCKSLTTAPQLPATTLADNCYNSMFYDCRSLTVAPTLSAETLVASCYKNMFNGCINLSSITCLATDISASACTSGWVTNVAPSGTFTKAANMSAWTSGNSGIPTSWTVEDKIDYTKKYLTVKSLADNNVVTFAHSGAFTAKTISCSTDNGVTWTSVTSESGVSKTLATLQTGDKLLLKGTNDSYTNHRISSTANAELEGNIESLHYGDNFENQTTCGNYEYFFSSWTTLKSCENLKMPATTLVENCYSYMFSGCTALTTPIEILPATTLARLCYRGMFSTCLSLTVAPILPATTLVYFCYCTMFSNCRSLTTITCLATDISATYCTYLWLTRVSSTGTFTKAASMTAWTSGDSGIPNNWTVVDK